MVLSKEAGLAAANASIFRVKYVAGFTVKYAAGFRVK